MTSLGLVDTSFFIAMETGRPVRVELLPDEALISVITLGELHTALHTAPSPAALTRRLRTFELASRFEALVITSSTARLWGQLRAAARSLGQARVNDLWIAATGLEHELTVFTQDEGFTHLAAIGGPPVVLL
jgi:predicted nucleic acid-binding protein